MKQLKEGKRVQQYSLTDKDTVTHTVPDATADFTVLFFYPKDDTPGCTIEAREFSSSLKKFTTRNVALFGVSGGNDKTKQSFCKKHNLSVVLLSDTDFSVATAYGAYGDKKFMGRAYKGILRKTFILDKNGVVVKVFDSVKPEGHANEVLLALANLTGDARRNKKAGAPRAARVASTGSGVKAVKKAASKKKPISPAGIVSRKTKVSKKRVIARKNKK